MDAITPLSEPILRKAVLDLAGDPSVIERLAWWSQHAHSAERWLQFELAFRLERILAGAWSVGCERDYIDLVFYRSGGSHPLWSSDYAAGLELKWYANWWLKDGAKGFLADVAKIRKNPLPAAALGIWFVAWPHEGIPRLAWIRTSIDRSNGVREMAEVRARLKFEPPPDFECEVLCRSHSDFQSISLLALAYLNDVARSGG